MVVLAGGSLRDLVLRRQSSWRRMVRSGVSVLCRGSSLTEREGEARTKSNGFCQQKETVLSRVKGLRMRMRKRDRERRFEQGPHRRIILLNGQWPCGARQRVSRDQNAMNVFAISACIGSLAKCYGLCRFVML